MLTTRMHILPPTASGPQEICPLHGATRHHPPSTLPPTLHIPGPLHPTGPHCCSAMPPRLPAQPCTPTNPPRRWRQGQVTQASHVIWPISSSSSDDADSCPTYDPCPALTPPSPSTTRPPPPSLPLRATSRCPLRFPPPPFSHRDPPPPTVHTLAATHPSPVLAAHERAARPHRLPVFFWGKAILTARTMSSRRTQAMLACCSHSHREAPPHPCRSCHLTLVCGLFLYGKVCTKLHM